MRTTGCYSPSFLCASWWTTVTKAASRECCLCCSPLSTWSDPTSSSLQTQVPVFTTSDATVSMLQTACTSHWKPGVSVARYSMNTTFYNIFLGSGLPPCLHTFTNHDRHLILQTPPSGKAHLHSTCMIVWVKIHLKATKLFFCLSFTIWQPCLAQKLQQIQRAHYRF